MYTEEQLEKLEKEENHLTEVALIAIFAWLYSTKSEMEKELRSFYQKYGKDGGVTYSEVRQWISKDNHQKRLTWLTLFVGMCFSNLFINTKPEFEKLVNDVVQKEFDFFGVAPDFLRLNWGADNLTWADRLADNVNSWEAYVMNDIKRSILAKKDIDSVIELLDKRFLTMENITKRLAVTETTAVASLARQAAFKELGITKYQYFAREDERTCEQCGALHGLIFPISAYEVGATAPCLHPGCRCWTVPIRE